MPSSAGDENGTNTASSAPLAAARIVATTADVVEDDAHRLVRRDLAVAAAAHQHEDRLAHRGADRQQHADRIDASRSRPAPRRRPRPRPCRPSAITSAPARTRSIRSQPEQRHRARDHRGEEVEAQQHDRDGHPLVGEEHRHVEGRSGEGRHAEGDRGRECGSERQLTSRPPRRSPTQIDHEHRDRGHAGAPRHEAVWRDAEVVGEPREDAEEREQARGEDDGQAAEEGTPAIFHVSDGRGGQDDVRRVSSGRGRELDERQRGESGRGGLPSRRGLAADVASKPEAMYWTIASRPPVKLVAVVAQSCFAAFSLGEPAPQLGSGGEDLRAAGDRAPLDGRRVEAEAGHAARLAGSRARPGAPRR